MQWTDGCILAVSCIKSTLKTIFNFKGVKWLKQVESSIPTRLLMWPPCFNVSHRSKLFERANSRASSRLFLTSEPSTSLTHIIHPTSVITTIAPNISSITRRWPNQIRLEDHALRPNWRPAVVMPLGSLRWDQQEPAPWFFVLVFNRNINSRHLLDWCTADRH